MADGDSDVRQVRLPAGWEGLSFKQYDGHLLVAEVPKACFSSAAFAASGALKPQVEGVSEGDEIVTLNGETPARVVEKIAAAGDPWNSCSSSRDTAHAVGSKGKFDSPPCAACDFIRRRKTLGLDVALQMWLRAVKRDIQITLGVKRGSKAQLVSLSPSAPPLALTPGISKESKPVVVIKDSSGACSLGQLKSLDDIAHEANHLKAKRGNLKSCKGKGKKGLGKGKAKARPLSGPDLPRTRVSTQPVTGEIAEWKGTYGWIVPSTPVDHPDSSKHRGRIYIHERDLMNAYSLEQGMTCWFLVFSDASGLGAEECIVAWDGGKEYSEDDGKGGWDEYSGEWDGAGWSETEYDEYGEVANQMDVKGPAAPDGDLVVP